MFAMPYILLCRIQSAAYSKSVDTLTKLHGAHWGVEFVDFLEGFCSVECRAYDYNIEL